MNKVEAVQRKTAIPGGGGGGGTLIFSCSKHFLGFKILNFNIFGGFQKNQYFLGYEDFVDIFVGVITNYI